MPSDTHFLSYNPAGNYMFKVNIRNTRTRCEIYLKLTIKTPERRHWRLCGVLIINFEHIISCLVLVFLLLTLSGLMPHMKYPKVAKWLVGIFMFFAGRLGLNSWNFEDHQKNKATNLQRTFTWTIFRHSSFKSNF